MWNSFAAKAALPRSLLQTRSNALKNLSSLRGARPRFGRIRACCASPEWRPTLQRGNEPDTIAAIGQAMQPP